MSLITIQSLSPSDIQLPVLGRPPGDFDFYHSSALCLSDFELIASGKAPTENDYPHK